MASHGIKTLATLGQGQMGLGISYVAATKAKIPRVYMVDANPIQLDKGLKFFDALLAKDVKKNKMTQDEADEARSRIKPLEKIQDFSKENHTVEMVIEAATENLQTKLAIFKSLANELPLSTILATNTSSISVSKIAASAFKEGGTDQEKIDGPKRAIGLHFFNPVPVMKLVELIPALQTSEDVVTRSEAFAIACGKTVTKSADVPGFVSNRLLMPFINEAVMTLEKGIATKEDIDTTLKLGMAHPMGPLRLADMIGLDTCYFIMQTMQKETGDSKYRPSVLLSRLVDAGRLGVKSKEGFYKYD